jgi:hypothetical protein
MSEQFSVCPKADSEFGKNNSNVNEDDGHFTPQRKWRL